MEYEVGFLGYGRMARALSDGLAQKGIPYSRQIVSGRNRERLESLAKELGVAVAPDNAALAESTKTVILGVKPYQVEHVLEEVGDRLNGRLLISMAVGIRLATLKRMLPDNTGLVKVMPNIAALVGSGLTLLCSPAGTDDSYIQRAKNIFEVVGDCLELDEKLFDAGGAISGSGPAYFFYIMEAMVQAGVCLGLTHEQARQLVVQTALGSALTAKVKTDQHLSGLRDMITSPGGTTAEALYVMDKQGLSGVLQEAVLAAEKKSRKLAGQD